MLLLSSQLNSTLRDPVGPTIFLSTSAVFLVTEFKTTGVDGRALGLRKQRPTIVKSADFNLCYAVVTDEA